MNSYVSKDINLAHCKIIVFSEKVATQGISKEIYSFVNDIQLRPDTCVIISRCDAKDYIEQKGSPRIEMRGSGNAKLLSQKE